MASDRLGGEHWVSVHEVLRELDRIETERSGSSYLLPDDGRPGRETLAARLASAALHLVETGRDHRTDVLLTLSGGDPLTLDLAREDLRHLQSGDPEDHAAALRMLRAAHDRIVPPLTTRRWVIVG